MHFSDPKNAFRSWYPEEQGVEWQAHTYAQYFLVPDRFVAVVGSAQELALLCGVPLYIAELRLSRWKQKQKRQLPNPDQNVLSGQLGDTCTACGSFTLVRQGLVIYCDLCGTSAGCA